MFARGVMESIGKDHVRLEVCHFDDNVVVLVQGGFCQEAI